MGLGAAVRVAGLGVFAALARALDRWNRILLPTGSVVAEVPHFRGHHDCSANHRLLPERRETEMEMGRQIEPTTPARTVTESTPSAQSTRLTSLDVFRGAT